MSSTSRGNTKRRADDFYATPEWCTKELIDLIDWSKVRTFCEPCLGEGAIYDLIPMEEVDKYWYEIRMGRNYLNGLPLPVDLIITNPPFSMAMEFIQRALTHGLTVIMLLRINFLASQGRKEFWKEHPPSHLLTLSRRPSFTGTGTDSADYAWFVWNGEDIIKGERFQWL